MKESVESSSAEIADTTKAHRQVNGTGLSRRSFLRGAALAAGAAATGMGQSHWLLSEAQAQTASGAIIKPTLYLIATAHNDTQWNWTVQHTINDCIPATMVPNWKLFEKYPDYNFNYEGVIHYMFFKEYHPDQWATLQDWVRKGRWKLSGSWINAVDVNVPSAESLFRQALYGQQFFRREFGQVSRDIYLPDCFGFPYSLPSIGRHSGLIAFSTQKLGWGCWIPAPYSVGRWEGPDGSQLVSALRPGSYTSQIRSDVARDAGWTNDLAHAGDREVNLRYFGTGDQGGTPDEESVQWAQKSVEDKDAAVRVLSASADQLAKDLTPTEIAALPHYKGELVMKTHGVGCYTSQAALKKWNRMSEQLADAAERASLAAAWLGGPAYPQEMLNTAWIRTLWHQFHDDLPGTCIPQAYTFSWNDDVLSLLQFSQVLATGVGAVAQHLDTRVQGVPLIVYNPLDQPRTDAAEAEVTLPHASPSARVFDAATGAEVPSQVLAAEGGAIKLVFIGTAPAVGWRVYDVRPSDVPCSMDTGLKANANSVESDCYRVTVNEVGDIAGVYDKRANTELLKAPATLQQMHDFSSNWPAWEILWDTVHNPPRGMVNENPRFRVLENGPARVALEVTRSLGDSTFVQQLRLIPGGDWVEVRNDVDWRTPGTLVKAAFPMTATNPQATFDLGLGTIERPNAQPDLYEVNAQQWADLTDAGGGHGLAILTNYKYGWDKPDDNTLRLSLIRTPDSGGSWQHQQTNDIGSHHEFSYGLAGHTGDWRKGRVSQQAARFNQPLRTFQTASHAGAGGRAFSLLNISTDQVAVRALKKAEEGEEWVIRLQELHGEQAGAVTVALAAPITSAREINAAEEVVGAYHVQGGKLVLDLTPYQPRSFAIRVARPARRIQAPAAKPIPLPFSLDGISLHTDLKDGAFDRAGQAYPGELWPAHLEVDGIPFTLGSSAAGAKNMVECKGQTIRLPGGRNNRLYLLAASLDGDQTENFVVHGGAGSSVTTALKVQDWAQHVGQWDSRLAHYTRGDGGAQVVSQIKDGKVLGIDRMTPAYVKRDNVAWVGTHRHNIGGDQAYLFCYLFKYGIDLQAGASAVTLPNNPNIRLMAITAASNTIDNTRPAGVLFEPGLLTAPAGIPAPQHLAPGTVVFQQDGAQSFDGTGDGFEKDGLGGLPTEADMPWTINMYVYTEQQPGDLTLLGGFGDATDTRGAERYLARVHGGIQFWGSNIDIDTGQPFDLGKWQMLTVTFDGATIGIYKNGTLIKSDGAVLDEAVPAVRIAPPGPWQGSHNFTGKIQGFAIWNSALMPEAIHAVLGAMPRSG
jgi:alpha-mannosidase